MTCTRASCSGQVTSGQWAVRQILRVDEAERVAYFTASGPPPGVRPRPPLPGVFGHSGGGFAAARAVLVFPETYKVGAVLSGSHDARHFNAGFVEAWDGVDNPEAWGRTSDIDLANTFIDHLSYGRTCCWGFLVRELLGTQPPAYRPAPIAIGPELLAELFA
ncbi:S9 family peptidase [Streptomyces sp. AP-93]|uniref:alpha/beta hydrolase family protein n=1 Tax=Streptomyces sp. AP-93 TaxID=2929048 RepID=UPI001FAF449B|nr:DPP IV N-terminal domain-containing protein [Streptomyces sp. AP-93]MCJ0869634.1 DPP IV N-terminal domain-containing protein [Streptomyces sp. AP-93]